jgi:hypothetical protein
LSVVPEAGGKVGTLHRNDTAPGRTTT